MDDSGGISAANRAAGAVSVGRARWRDGAADAGRRSIPEETPVAITYDASTYAVMMATPLDLEDFAVGFSLTEGVVTRPEDIREVQIVPSALGVEARMWLTAPEAAALAGRRRRIAGPTGCGLCGIDSLAEAAKTAPIVAGALSLTADQVLEAMAALAPAQALNAETRAVHAAAFWRPGEGLVAVREDVGRHNALDKLAGALARAAEDGAPGAVLLTSRVSVEMVQKTAVLGAPILIAVSAPTALAVKTAEQAGITLAAVARSDGFEVFTHAERIVGA
jgi:FdhD protein